MNSYTDRYVLKHNMCWDLAQDSKTNIIAIYNKQKYVLNVYVSKWLYWKHAEPARFRTVFIYLAKSNAEVPHVV